MRGAPVGVGDGWHGGGRLGDRAEKEGGKRSQTRMSVVIGWLLPIDVGALRLIFFKPAGSKPA
jgi:hypothetical protein